MRGFSYIIETLYPEIDIHRSAYEFPSNRNSAINEDFVSYSFINSLHYGSVKIYDFSKFQILNDSILSNIFINKRKKEEILDKFCQAQRVYFALCNLARIYKVKKSRSSTIHYDCLLYTSPSPRD